MHPAPASVSLPEPLTYLSEVAAWLERHESALWRWQAQARVTSGATDAMRLQLLKQTYRLDVQAHASVYEHLAAVQARLGLDLPATVYQAPAPGGGVNASLWFAADEIHIVVHGPLLEQLEGHEIAAVFAHELGHHLLLTHDGGRLAIADRILAQSVEAGRAEPPVFETWRRWRLACELYADRIVLAATDSLAAAISTLVRVETAAVTVDPQAYLAQAREVLASGTTSEGQSHPECFVRAAVLAAWAEDDSGDAAFTRWVCGSVDPGRLDLLDQSRCVALTRSIVGAVLAPVWMRTDAVLGHARRFLDDVVPLASERSLDESLRTAAPGLRDYGCFVLLDFAAVCPELGELGLVHGIRLARQWGWEERFVEIAQRELKLKARERDRLRQEADALAAAADAQTGAQP